MPKRLASFLTIVAVLIGISAAIAPAASAESTPSAFASRLVSLINSARAGHGLAGLTVTSGTSTVAANWTEHLASAGSLSHNPNLQSQLESHGSANWTSYGENVGEGPSSSAQTLFNAYMNSPEHRANILGASYRYLGVGVVFTGSTAWNTLDFVDAYSSGTVSRTTSSTVVRHATSAPVRHAVRRPVTVTPKAPARPAHRAASKRVAHPQRAQVRAVASSLPIAALPAIFGPAAPSISLPMSHETPTPRHSKVPFVLALCALAVAMTGFAKLVGPRGA